MNAIERRILQIRTMEKMEELHRDGSNKIGENENGYIYRNSKGEVLISAQMKVGS